MRKPDHISGARAGFTILEVLVSMAILAMIATIVFGTFFYTVNNAEQLEDRVALYHRASYILDNISQSVSSAYAPYAGGRLGEEGERPPFYGKSGPLGDVQMSSLGTYTTAPRFTGDRLGADIAYVSYEVFEASEIDDKPGWVEDDNNPLVFACSVEPLLALSNNGDEAFDEARPMWTLNVRSLGFLFFDGTEWLEEWNFEDQGIFPDAVMIELELGDSDGKSHAFSTVATVHANALLEEAAEELAEELAEEETEEESEEEAEDEGEETGEEGEETGKGQEPNLFSPGDEGGGGIFPENPGSFPFGSE